MALRSLPDRERQRLAGGGAYLVALRIHAVDLLLRGYRQLDSGAYALEEEEVITGDLIDAIRAVIESPDAPEWAWHYQVHEDIPVKGEGRDGKRRRRVDIMFQRSAPGRHPRYHFEAKRLCRSGSASEYLGDEGLGCFTSGRYAGDELEAAMLGYVQTDDAVTWAGKIASRIAKHPEKYAVAKGSGWVDETVIFSLEIGQAVPAYKTRHIRPGSLGEIGVLHLLLDFLP